MPIDHPLGCRKVTKLVEVERHGQSRDGAVPVAHDADETDDCQRAGRAKGPVPERTRSRLVDEISVFSNGGSLHRLTG
jgi:hypothetical protein